MIGREPQEGDTGKTSEGSCQDKEGYRSRPVLSKRPIEAAPSTGDEPPPGAKQARRLELASLKAFRHERQPSGGMGAPQAYLRAK